MKLAKNKLAMFHKIDLSEVAIDYIITHCDPVKIINNLEQNIELYKQNFIHHYPFMDREDKILKELKEKIVIFDKK